MAVGKLWNFCYKRTVFLGSSMEGFRICAPEALLKAVGLQNDPTPLSPGIPHQG